MLKIVIPEREYFNENTEEFVYSKRQEITLEHSLISISKWESKWHKPFLDEKHEKTDEEFVDYVKCMALSPIDDSAIYNLTESNKREILNYIEDKMSATWFAESSTPPPSNEIITSELIYYWMIETGIPFECQKWHLNRLLTLIRVCALKNQPAKKMSPASILSQNTSLNKARRAMMNTRG